MLLRICDNMNTKTHFVAVMTAIVHTSSWAGYGGMASPEQLETSSGFALVAALTCAALGAMLGALIASSRPSQEPRRAMDGYVVVGALAGFFLLTPLVILLG